MTRGTPTDLLLQGQALLRRQIELANRWRCDQPGCDGLPHPGWLHNHAREQQWEPLDYLIWLIFTGRGWGKTRTGAETAKAWGLETRRHIAVLGKTDRETRNICYDGPGGLLSVILDQDIADYRRAPGETQLILKNGTVFRAFSSVQPESLRGYAFDAAWFDEYAAWHPNVAQDCWDNIWFCLREAKNPHLLLTTTPRNLPHVKKALEKATVVTRGSSLDNSANLSQSALEEIMAMYDGTRIGRQELYGELVEDVEGALWTWDLIERNRYTGKIEDLDLWKFIVGVDHAGTNNSTSDETGIVVVGAAGPRNRPDFYVLEDKSGRYSPDEWAKMAVVMYDKWDADAIAAEQNMGWDMVNATIAHQDGRVPIHKMRATRGKHLRAEPVVALYEQDRFHHCGNLTKLEEQMTAWTPFDTKYSPDRLDALVWAATDISEGPGTAGLFSGSLLAGIPIAPTSNPW